MRIAILTFDGFNELDTFIAAGLLNELNAEGWKAELACPTGFVTSMNGVVVQAQQPLEFANDALTPAGEAPDREAVKRVKAEARAEKAEAFRKGRGR